MFAAMILRFFPSWLLVSVLFAGSFLWSLVSKTSLRTVRPTPIGHDGAGTLLGSQNDPDADSSRGTKYERPCTTPEAQQWAYCDTSLPDSDRISWLLKNLTPEEKVSLLGNKAPALPRLSLPPYNWWSEGLHGVAFSCCPEISFKSTSFPQVCTTGASFNRSLFSALGDAIGAEAVEHFWTLEDVPGLTYWTPNVNLFRDPRWGRGQEVPSEDPFLNGEYAAALIPALQYGKDRKGRGDGLPRIAAACKHFAAYSIETGRMDFDSKVDDRDMEESYLPMFKECVASGVLGFMCSYNAVNGVPSCANADLLNFKLRVEWGFKGYVTGDCGALGNIYSSHNYTDSMEEGIATAIKAGVDSDCGGDLQAHGVAAFNAGLVSTHDIDRALRNLFEVQFHLGYYNPFSSRRARLQNRMVNNVHMHNALALDASRQGVVLLKNGRLGYTDASQRPLPLSREKYRTVALFGPNANAMSTMQGNYYGQPPFLVSPKHGLEDLGVDVEYFKGCNITASALENAKEICRAATASDATVLIMGLDQRIEREGIDRTILTLPATGQDQLIRLSSACAKREADKPVILVIMSGGPLDLGPYKKDKNIDAILYVGYPGQSGGTAIAEALFGGFSPSGRLSTTVYPAQFAEQVDIRDMRMRPTHGFPGRTHRYYTGKVVYPFGYGMSYSTFTRSVGSRSMGDSTFVDVTVHNQGPMEGAHSVLLFHSGPSAGHNGNPIQSLVGFDKIWLSVGEKKSLTFSISKETMTETGLHQFSLGLNEEDEDLMFSIVVS